MKNSLIISILLAIAAFWLNPEKSIAATPDSTFTKKDFIKTYNKDFPTRADGKVDLKNLYGTVRITSWKENRVTIKVTVTVKAENEENANKVFDKIDITFDNSDGFVKAETNVRFDEWKKCKNVDCKIDYDVSMPESNLLKLRNSYGDAYINKLTSKVELGIEYGNIKAQDLLGDMVLSLEYGEGDFGTVGSIIAGVSYGGINVDKTGEVTMKTEYSHAEIEQSKSITAQSDYDDYKIGKTGKVLMKANYGALKIKEVNSLAYKGEYGDCQAELLTGNATLEMEYGSCYLRHVGKDFTSIEFEGDYAGLEANIPSGTAVSYDLSTEYGEINVPLGPNSKVKSEDYGMSKSYQYTASGSNKKIKGTASYGSFIIKGE